MAWLAVKIVATVVLLGLAIVALVLPILRERRRRVLQRSRPIYSMQEWIRRFYPDYAEHSRIIEIVLKAVSELYGLQATRLRPTDCFQEDYGFFRSVIGDDTNSFLVEAVHRSLRKEACISWVPHADIKNCSLDEIIREVIRGDMFCAKCGYNMQGTASDRCPECGTVVAMR